MTITYCVKCRKWNDSNNEQIIKSNNGRKSLYSICNICGGKKYKFIKNNQKGNAIDIFKLIGKISRPKSGFTPGKYKYLGLYNNLDQQLEYEDNGKITNYHVKPYNKVDEIASKHHVCYSIGENKTECDKTMVKELHNLKYGDMTKWGQLARF